MKRKWTFKLLFFIGFLLCTFPLVSNIVISRRQTCEVQTYMSAVQENIDILHEIFEKAEEYNDMLYQAPGAASDPEGILWGSSYEEMLDVTGTGIMGSLEIPKIDVLLPIYHGTEEEVLADGIGHIQGTSLPIGGENTHSVLTGHRGLPSSKLLTRLDELEEGDYFFINICGEMLAYKIFTIQEVEPEDVSALEIQSGRDYSSIVTCTPYGLNTHRLIVTGERVPYKEKEYMEIEAGIPSGRELFFNLLPFLFVIVVIGSCFEKKIRRKKRRMRKRLKRTIMMIVLCISVGATGRVYAEEQGDTDEMVLEDAAEQLGDITVKLVEADSGEPVEGIMFYCIKIAELSDGQYILNEEYCHLDIDLNEINNSDELKYAAETLASCAGTGVSGVTDGEGIVKFGHLETGVYLICGEDNQEFDLIAPTLLSIPSFFEGTGEMEYSVEVEPKHEPRQEESDIPRTGDERQGLLYLTFGIAGITFFVLIFLLRYAKTQK